MTTAQKSLESWIWDAACSIRGARDAPKYKDYILPLIFTKRLCDVFDDEIDRIAEEVGSRKKAFQLARADHKLVRFALPLVLDDPEQPVWSVIRKLSDKIGESVTTHMRAIARENPLLQGIIDRVDFNATTHGSGGLLIKCELAMEAKMKAAASSPSPPSGERAGVRGQSSEYAPLKLFGQEYVPETWAMANMNMIIHDMEGQIEIGDTFKIPKFRAGLLPLTWSLPGGLC